jgi:hypothetical protein
LILSCDIPLPELAHVTAVEPNDAVDVRVELLGRRLKPSLSAKWFMTWSLPSGKVWLSTAKTDQGYLLRFHDLADFTVDTLGRQIVCFPGSGTLDGTLRHLLLDQVVPLVLTLHGRHALHATAVQMPQGVCAFIGPTGAGKSTLAASFLTTGYPVLSDDCLVLQEDQGLLSAIPAYPGLRLWDDSLEALPSGFYESYPLTHKHDKYRVLDKSRRATFPSNPQPLVRIYLLPPPPDVEEETDERKPCIEPITHREGFLSLLSSLFPLDITDKSLLAQQFNFLSRVTSLIPVRRLRIPRNFSALPAVREAILADLRNG